MMRFIDAVLILFILLLILVPGKAKADDEFWLVASVTSYHFKSGDYNQHNYGLGAEYGVYPDVRLVGGVYRNSLYRNSFYAGAFYSPLKLGPVNFGVIAGAVTGYSDGNKALPALIPMASIEGKTYGANVVVVPPTSKNVPGLIGLQLKYRPSWLK